MNWAAIAVSLSILTPWVSHLEAATQDEFQPGEIIVLFDSTASSVLDAAFSASQLGETEIGVAEFDAIGAKYGLRTLHASPQADISLFARSLYTLVFPAEVDIPSIASAYAALPFVSTAEPNYKLQTANVPEGDAIGISNPDDSVSTAGAKVTRLGDFNLDGVINFTDFFKLADAFETRLETIDNVYDLNNDSTVDMSDVYLFVDLF